MPRGDFEPALLNPDDIVHACIIGILQHDTLCDQRFTQHEACRMLGRFVQRECQHAARRQRMRNRWWRRLDMLARISEPAHPG